MTSSGSPLGALHHVGIAVPALDAPRDAIVRLLGGEVIDGGEDATLALAWTWIASESNPIIELLAPLTDGSVIARDLRRRGPGLHHLSWHPDSIAEAHDHVRRCCLPTIGEDQVVPGFEQLYIDPAVTGGALFHAFREVSDEAKAPTDEIPQVGSHHRSGTVIDPGRN